MLIGQKQLAARVESNCFAKQRQTDDMPGNDCIAQQLPGFHHLRDFCSARLFLFDEVSKILDVIFIGNQSANLGLVG